MFSFAPRPVTFQFGNLLSNKSSSSNSKVNKDDALVIKRLQINRSSQKDVQPRNLKKKTLQTILKKQFAKPIPSKLISTKSFKSAGKVIGSNFKDVHLSCSGTSGGLFDQSVFFSTHDLIHYEKILLNCKRLRKLTVEKSQKLSFGLFRNIGTIRSLESLTLSLPSNLFLKLPHLFDSLLNLQTLNLAIYPD